MDAVNKLNKEFIAQDFASGGPFEGLLEKYRGIARGYSEIENSISVLSDLRAHNSYIYYGGLSQIIGLDDDIRESRCSSIWEEKIFRLVHPDDLASKHVQELRFFNFIKRLPRHEKSQYYLVSELRMRTSTGNYIPVQHKMFYITLPDSDTIWLALCLYSPLAFRLPSNNCAVNSLTGQMIELDDGVGAEILSKRERQVLGLIDKGLTSKDIATLLSISINTVNRHRQEILCKLRVHNSIEACRIGKDLRLL